jgi:hypothetical protein
MTGVAPTPHRDDSAWPRGAVPLSLVIAVSALAGGIAVVVNNHKLVVAAASLLVGALVGSSLIVIAIKRWLAGRSVPGWLGLFGALFSVGGTVLMNGITHTGAGLALMAGVIGGMMAGNVWAVRAARANRPATSR